MTKTATKATATTIHSSAMLVKFFPRKWSAARFDKKITREVNDTHAASHDAGRWNKHLMKNAEPYRRIVLLKSRLRDEHYKQTLPWNDRGWRLLPTANFEQYATFVRKARAEWESAVADFLAEYEQLVDSDRQRLNGMFNESDYPSAREIAKRFWLRVEYNPVPAEGDFRLDLPVAQLEAVEQNAQERVARSFAAAVTDGWARLHEIVSHLAERCELKPNARHDDAAITAAREMVDILTRLNISGDKNLEKIRKQVEGSIAKLDVDTLKEDSARTAAAEKAKSILDTMSAFFTPPTVDEDADGEDE
jgi:hypothetical protein